MKMRRLLSLAALFVVGIVPVSAGAVVTATLNDMTQALVWWEPTSFVGGSPIDFEFTNNTGVVWDDFHVWLDGDGDVGTDYPFMRFTDLGLDGVIYYGAGTASFFDLNMDGFGYNEKMDVVGLNILNGGLYSFSVDIVGGVFPEGLTKFIVYAQPSGSTQPQPSVPEPSTMALLGIGLVGLAGLKRRMKK